MFGVFDKIEEFFNNLLIGIIEQNLTSLLVDVNDRVGTIAAEVGKTPQAWNGSIFTMIKNLSDTVIVPIAGLVMTGILCYELLSMLMEKNNLHEVDTWMFFRWMMKAVIAIYFVTNTFNIVMAVFDVGQHIVSASAGVINTSTSIDISSSITSMVDGLELLSTAELATIALETVLVKISILAISIITLEEMSPTSLSGGSYS
ncbi:Tn5252 [Fusibacter sp. 3D3]|nr:CD0415/CD1112 family protein [Fusibacter sp. 3D3]GAU79891.1 Tn5252 [Fusibacter sp. 3D3]